MGQVLTIGDLMVDVVRKDIKNLHLSVHPPTGRIRIAAPRSLGIDAIRAYAISRIAWIRRNQKRLLLQPREPARDYLERESHYVWGERVLMTVRRTDCSPKVDLQHKTLVLSVRDGSSREERHHLVETWYRAMLKHEAEIMLAKWEDRLAVRINRLLIQRMKTKWGSCNPASRNIRLNTELGKKPRECLDYVLLHELAHLIEPTHSDRFHAILDAKLPQWRDIRQLLNSLPLGS
jgi:hypothetical protein